MHAITDLIQALTNSLSRAGGMNIHHTGLITSGSLSSSQHYTESRVGGMDIHTGLVTGSSLSSSQHYADDADRSAAERRIASLMSALPQSNPVCNLLRNSELKPHLQVDTSRYPSVS